LFPASGEPEIANGINVKSTNKSLPKEAGSTREIFSQMASGAFFCGLGLLDGEACHS
jgi:hypothetical protein